MDLCSLTEEQLAQWLKDQALPSFRAQQIFDWVYQKKALSFDEMTNVSKELRATLSKHFSFPVIKLLDTKKSQETSKFLWELADGKRVESVLIYSFDRRTVCLSSQVGCPARCAFCASGKQGLIRNLSTAEIVEQALLINRILHEQEGSRITHIVYMGMGEPLENYEAVTQSIRLLTHEQGLNLSQRRITLSTVGIIEGILRLAEETDFRINLVLSLHAPTQHLRQKIIPFARKYPLEELLEAVSFYSKRTKRDITFEYTLIAGINDNETHAKELANLLRYTQCTINLIPYNPIEGIRLLRPEKSAVAHFRNVLEEEGLNVTWRYTKGDDIAAACGQLALQH